MVGLNCLIGMSWSEIINAKVNWQKKIDREGIQVFQHQQKGFRQKHNKGVITIKTRPERLTALMEDLSLCKQWLYGCITAKQFNDGLIHMVFKGPLWFKDRDVVMSTKTEYITEKKQWLVTTQSEANRHPNDYYVRINQTQASWLITEVSNTQIQVTYELYIDPEISLKSGVNKYNRDAMYLSLNKIRKLLEAQN